MEDGKLNHLQDNCIMPVNSWLAGALDKFSFVGRIAAEVTT